MYKNVLIIGAGKSGLAIANAIGNTKNVMLYDSKVLDVCDGLNDNVEVYLGENIDVNELIKRADTLILSPGVSMDSDIVVTAKKLNKEIIGEIEAAYNICKLKDKILGVTGTNGKTTTTSLLAHIIKTYDENTYALGNIGTAFAEKASSVEKGNLVLELSSFQLETIKEFRPKVACILNISPDHLNRHHSMENYINAKKNIFKNQTNQDYLILNFDDEETRKMKYETEANVLYFSSKTELEDGAFLKDNKIVLKDKRNELVEVICDINDLKIIGIHNAENTMAAVLMAYVYNVPLSVIKEAVLTFTPVPHRIEYVATVDGVKYYNDSKGTNPDSSIKAILAMNSPIVIIIGGYDKKISFDEFVSLFEGRVKHAVIIGQVTEQLVETCERFNFKNYTVANEFIEALEIARSIAKDGDNILLSPACASWGMFDNYEQRGDIFKTYVNNINK